MIRSTSVRLPYSLLFISDPECEEDPEPSIDHLSWTEFSVCISCQHGQNGPTTVTLGLASEVAEKHDPVFDGEIHTPSHKLALSTATFEVVLQITIGQTKTRVRIWENRPIEPDRIVVAVG